MTTKEYLYTDETNLPRELAHGMVREPPAPFFPHQQVALKIARLLADHVEAAQLGQVGIAPLDVVLDADSALVVQPDASTGSSSLQTGRSTVVGFDGPTADIQIARLPDGVVRSAVLKGFSRLASALLP